MKFRNKHTGELVEHHDLLVTPMKLGNIACADWIAGWQVTTNTYVGKFYHQAFWEPVQAETKQEESS